MELKKVLTDIVCSIVDKPEEVQVTETGRGNELVLVLTVAPGDMGKVIGKQGKIAKALRTIVNAVSKKNGKRCNIEIKSKN